MIPMLPKQIAFQPLQKINSNDLIEAAGLTLNYNPNNNTMHASNMESYMNKMGYLYAPAV